MTGMRFWLLAAAMLISASTSWAAKSADAVDETVTVTAEAAGTDLNAQEEAVKMALRKAVEQTCGTYIRAQTKTKNYQTVYDKVLTNTGGYVVSHEVVKTWKDDEKTFATVKARVSTRKFEEKWVAIAHTIEQENNPRVIVAIAEATSWTASGPAYQVNENGTVQGKVEDFLNEKGIVLMDRATASKVSKRDLLLANIKDDVSEIAAMGARFKADVVVTGTATAKLGKKIEVGERDMHQDMYQYTCTITIRAVQTDSARILVSKTYSKSFNEPQRNAEDKALVKLADEASPKFLEALVEAWAKRANVTRTVDLSITGMDWDTFKTFKVEAEKIRGVQAIRMREITEAVAAIDVEFEFTNENLADRLTALKTIKLKVVEITANRIKAKVTKE